MFFCAHYLGWLAMGTLIVWALLTTNQFFAATLLSLLTAGCAYLVSYAIAFVFPHERPQKEFPNVNVLFNTLGTWKSFPSDHTIWMVIVLAVASFLAVPTILFAVLTVWALAVMIGRVYCGVHYPRDILGGILIGSAFSYLFLIIFT